jgi:hypothetical protein
LVELIPPQAVQFVGNGFGHEATVVFMNRTVVLLLLLVHPKNIEA